MVLERIKEYIDFKGISISFFEKSIGMSNASFGKSLKNKGAIGSDKLEIILNVYKDLNPVWLLTGEGEMLQSSEPSPVSGTATGRPYYDVDFRCGFDEMVNDQTSVPACLISYPPYDRDGVLWCNATGNSMSPEINPGDIIALQEVHDWQSFLAFGETYAIAAANGLRTIKKVRKGSTPDTLLLVPVNRAEHDEQEIEKAQITHVFRVLAAIKKF